METRSKEFDSIIRNIVTKILLEELQASPYEAGKLLMGLGEFSRLEDDKRGSVYED